MSTSFLSNPNFILKTFLVFESMWNTLVKLVCKQNDFFSGNYKLLQFLKDHARMKKDVYNKFFNFWYWVIQKPSEYLRGKLYTGSLMTSVNYWTLWLSLWQIRITICTGWRPWMHSPSLVCFLSEASSLIRLNQCLDVHWNETYQYFDLWYLKDNLISICIAFI